MNVYVLTYWQDFWEALKKNFIDLLPGHRDLREHILNVVNYGPIFSFKLFGYTVNVSEAAVSMVLAVLVILVLSLLLRPRMRVRAGRFQVLVEQFFGLIENACRSGGMNEKQLRIVTPYIASLGLLIGMTNLSAVLYIKPAAVNPIFPATLAFFDLLYIIFVGIKLVGWKGFVNSLLSPMPALLPFNLLDYIIKPISLAFRLFGNVFGAFVLMTFVELIIPVVLPSVLGLWFDIGDSIVQAVVFCYLTINYLCEIVENAEAAKERGEQRLAAKEAKRQAKLAAKSNAGAA